MENLLIFIMLFGLGILFLYLGYLLSFKQKIDVMHDYHYTNVKDKEGYTKTMGSGLFVIGFGCTLSGIMSLFANQFIVWIPLVAATVIGIVIMVYGQFKYNKGIF